MILLQEMWQRPIHHVTATAATACQPSVPAHHFAPDGPQGVFVSVVARYYMRGQEKEVLGLFQETRHRVMPSLACVELKNGTEWVEKLG